MPALYLLSLDQTWAFVAWAALTQIGCFYLQRPFFEERHEWGTETRWKKHLSAIAAAIGWATYASVLYILLRVGLLPAITALIVMFVAPLIVSTLDVWIVRSPAFPMVVVFAPVTAIATVMALRAALIL